MAPAIISYREAKAKGLKRYFTGKKCKHGHLAERFVINCGCCECTLVRTDAWIEENIETKRACFRDWQRRNKKYQAGWVKKNPDKRRKTARNWYVKNTESSIERSLRWFKNNPEKRRAIVRNRTARRKNALGKHTAEEVLEMLKRQKWKCAACGVSIRKRRHIDHRIPLVLGGSNDISNLQGLCPTCNCRKGPKHPDVWARENGKLL
jgi:hypothetical protein